jgi:hypothetical protein
MPVPIEVGHCGAVGRVEHAVSLSGGERPVAIAVIDAPRTSAAPTKGIEVASLPRCEARRPSASPESEIPPALRA